MFARHGFQNLAEKANLSRLNFQKPEVDIEQFSNAERVRMCFEQLGPTFVKLGQLLATRPDLVPPEFSDEFKKLHNQVPALDFTEIEGELNRHFSGGYKNYFKEFNPKPIGAASIAQVYKAKLKSGESVVVKVQRPGIEKTIREDLSVLYTLSELLLKYVEDTRVYNPVGIVDEFYKTLELETNFVIEANNIRRFQQNFVQNENIVIPKVYTELSGSKVLVMEELDGIPLSHHQALKQENVDPQQVLKVGLSAFFRMVFSDGIFHGDLHAGNLFVMTDNKVGLIDFGVVGRLNSKTQAAIANMFISLAMEDYERLAYEYVDLAPYSGFVDTEMFARDLRDVFAPFYGLTLEHVNIGKLMMDSSAVAASHHLTLPSELVMFFKSIVTIEGMGRQISNDFDFLSHSMEFATELVQKKYDPKKYAKDLFVAGKDYNSLVLSFPRQIKQLLKKINDPKYSLQIKLHEIESIKLGLESSSKKQFAGLVAASLILSSTLLVVFEKGPFVMDFPLLSLIGYGFSLFLLIIFLF